MGQLSRLPNSNDPPSQPSGNPWGPVDETFGLLNGTAVRCCTCRRAVSTRHVTIKDHHAFCPDHAEETKCSRDGQCWSNVERFIEHQNPDRDRCGASGEAGEAD